MQQDNGHKILYPSYLVKVPTLHQLLFYDSWQKHSKYKWLKNVSKLSHSTVLPNYILKDLLFKTVLKFFHETQR